MAVPFKIECCSSESKSCPVSNLLEPGSIKIWETATPTDTAQVDINLKQPTTIAKVVIGNVGCAFIELLVVNDDSDDWKVLLPMAMLMSHSDSQNGKNRFREWTFTKKTPSALRSVISQQKWSKMRVFLRQPFQTPQNATTIGLSFIQIFSSDNSESDSEEKSPGQKLTPAEKMRLAIDHRVAFQETKKKNLQIFDNKAQVINLDEKSKKNQTEISEDSSKYEKIPENSVKKGGLVSFKSLKNKFQETGEEKEQKKEEKKNKKEGTHSFLEDDTELYELNKKMHNFQKSLPLSVGLEVLVKMRGGDEEVSENTESLSESMMVDILGVKKNIVKGKKKASTSSSDTEPMDVKDINRLKHNK